MLISCQFTDIYGNLPIKEDDLFFNVSGATCAAIILFKQIVCQVRDSKQDGSRMWAEKKYVNLPCQSSSSLFYFLLFFFILFGMQRYECFLEWQKIFLGMGKGGQLGAIGSTDSHMVISSWSIWAGAEITVVGFRILLLSVKMKGRNHTFLVRFCRILLYAG